MVLGLGSALMGLEPIEALGPDDILTLRVYEEIPILGANGIVAIVDLWGFRILEGRVMYSITNGRRNDSSRRTRFPKPLQTWVLGHKLKD